MDSVTNLTLSYTFFKTGEEEEITVEPRSSGEGGQEEDTRKKVTDWTERVLAKTGHGKAAKTE